jgi:pimeloyl-ACP methyl ester carboxylesterase
VDWLVTVFGTVVAVVLFVDLIYHLAAIKVAVPIFEHQPPFAVESFPPDSRVERITFPTSHGLMLQGSLFRQESQPPRGLIIFCPELGANRWSASAYCEGLLDSGFDVFSFDFRNQGDSDPMPGYEPIHWLTEFEVDDVLAAIAYIQSRVGLKDVSLGVMGVSRGGAAALVTAARSPIVRCVASDGAFSAHGMLLHYAHRWGRLYFPEWFLRLLPEWHLSMTVSIVRWVSQVRRGCLYANLERVLPLLQNKPVLMVSGERDTYVIPEITRRLYHRTGHLTESVWIVDGAKHNLARQVNPVEYNRRMVEFFSVMEDKQRTSRSLPSTNNDGATAWVELSVKPK